MAQYFTVKDVAKVLQLSRSKVYKLKESGDLHVCKIGNCIRISDGQLTEYLQRCEQPQSARK